MPLTERAQREHHAAQVLVGLGAILALSPRRERDPDAAERDDDEGADDGQRQQELQQG